MKEVADKKKSQNIGEYILYMYQMEDLIRAYGFDLNDINQYVVKHYPVSETEKANISTWFKALAKTMKDEGICEKGHLSEIVNLTNELAKIHWNLLKTDPQYHGLYQKAKPHIIKLVMEAGTDVPGNEIQICLNAVYGRLLARLKGREIPKEMIEATEVFGDMLSYLNLTYFEEMESKIRNN